MITALPQAASTPSPTPNNPASPSTMGLNPNMFITLLIAQLKNQDPTSPMDPTQFVNQLVQFNSLEQLIGINQELQPPPPPAGGSGGTGNGSGNGSGNSGGAVNPPAASQ